MERQARRLMEYVLSDQMIQDQNENHQKQVEITNLKQNQNLDLIKLQRDVDKNQQHYKYGQFSKFAVQNQKQEQQKQIQINVILRQAIFSHLKAVRQYIKIQKQLNFESEENLTELKKHFNLDNITWNKSLQISNFIEDPIQYTLKQSMKLKLYNVKSILEKYIQRLLVTRKYLIVQGKILKITNLRMQEYTQSQGKISIPLNYKNIILSYSQNKIPYFEYFDGTENVSKNFLMKMKQSERIRIIDMVYKFLIQKKIIVNKTEIEQKIFEIIKEQIFKQS